MISARVSLAWLTGLSCRHFLGTRSAPNAQAWRVLIALLALAAGAAVYAWARPMGHAQWAPWLGLAGGTVAMPAWVGALPSLLHVLAFGMLSAALLPEHSRAGPAACIAWGALNLLAEGAQHPLAQAALVEPLTALPGGMPLARYVAQGRFDPLDLVAAIAGTVLGLFLLRLGSPPVAGASA